MPETYYIVPKEKHDALVKKAYLSRGYTADEAAAGARFCSSASYYGIRTHNAIKALHLDELFGSKVGRWKPGAKIEKLPSRFAAAEIWNAHFKLGQAVAYEAMDTCMKLADKFGVGMVSVDNATHYLWGGGYVMDAAKKGYIAYTNCTAALAEVAQQDPSVIKNMISENDNGTYSVDFQINGKSDYVTVNNELPTFGYSWANGSKLEFANGPTSWAPLIEKAYVELNEQTGAGIYGNNAAKGASYADINGGGGYSLTQITGQSVTYATPSGDSAAQLAPPCPQIARRQNPRRRDDPRD